MKIQCSCGAKYEFEVTPEMAGQPVRFVCPACGADSSEFVNQLVRQQLELAAEAARPVAPPIPVPVAANASICRKHPGMVATQQCRVCGTPICPKCMELFGYVCSPLCKANAARRRLAIPVFAGQRTVVEARLWPRMRLVASVAGVLGLLLLGAWGWYAWVGSQPRAVFSTRFAEPAFSGQTRMCGADQLLVLHGATVARYDLKQKREVWSHQVIDVRGAASGRSAPLSAAEQEEFEQKALRAAASQLELRVKGQNIWVIAPNKLVLLDYSTGRPVKESPLNAGEGEMIERGDELLVMNAGTAGRYVITHWDLAKAQSSTEEIVLAKAGGDGPGLVAATKSTQGSGPGVSGQSVGGPLDPTRLAAQAQAMSKPAKIALPALLANSLNQERILAELNDARVPTPGSPAPPAARAYSLLLPIRDGFIRLSVRLVESRIITRSAMKAPPAKSVLNGELNVTQTTEVANELLNDMQRSRGGDIVHEDQSRYLVSLSQPDGSKEWTGPVVGPPALHALETVNVLTAGRTIHIFNRNNQLLWQSELAFGVQAGEARFGQGPCVERDGALFVFDEGVVSAFELATGKARWRLPSIGVQGLLFDHDGTLYINTTTASPDKLKFSRQIDISEKIAAEILKVDSRTGKTLWSARPGGFVASADGKFVYALQSHTPDEEDSTPLTGFETPAYTRVRRLDPETGRELWQHFQDRAPLDVQFDRNNVRLVFKREVQVLRFLSF